MRCFVLAALTAFIFACGALVAPAYAEMFADFGVSPRGIARVGLSSWYYVGVGAIATLLLVVAGRARSRNARALLMTLGLLSATVGLVAGFNAGQALVIDCRLT